MKGELLVADSSQLETNYENLNYRDLSNALILIQTDWMSTTNWVFCSFNFPIFQAVPASIATQYY
jgi:hypothetical protein